MKKLLIGVFAVLAMGIYSCSEDTAFEENPEFVPTATGDNPQIDKKPGGETGSGGGTGGGGVAMPDLADTAKSKRVAVLEDFTGVKCQFCPDGARIAEQIETALGDKFITIATHGGGFASPTGGVLYPSGDTLFYAEFRSGFDAALISQAGVNSYPSGTMNRLHVQNDFGLNANISPPLGMSRSNWQNTANQVNAMDAPVNIGTNVTLSGRDLKIDVELYYTEEETEKNYIHVGILQDGRKSLQVNWTSSTGGFYDSAYVQNNILRTYLTGQWGEEVAGTTTKGFIYDKTYNYTIPDYFVTHPSNRRDEGKAVIDDLSIVIFVSRDKTNILNAVEVDVP